MAFCDELKQEANLYWEASFRHPFVKGIVAGNLDLELFKFYMMQDAYYLKHYTKVLALAAVIAEKDQVAYFLEQSRQIYEAELEIHDTVFKHLKVNQEELEAFIPAPATHNYISHLYQVTYNGDVAEAFAAILPCPWLYQEIGEKYKAAQPEPILYQNWLTFYGSSEYKGAIEEQKQMMNEYAAAQPHKKAIFKAHFVKSCYYEWKFWDMSWTLENWEDEVMKYDYAKNS